MEYKQLVIKANKENKRVVKDNGVYKLVETKQNKTNLEKRVDAYGTTAQQIEFITENGLEAWQQKVADIKAQFPLEV